MCGIIGYVGKNRAFDYIFKGLEKLEYIGYDGVGYALLANIKFEVIKDTVRVVDLKSKKCKNIDANIGVGHIRGATHGKAVAENTHPHLSFDGRIAIVHNGIIENYVELKDQILKKDITLKSDTDSEIIAHLIALNYTNDIKKAISVVVEQLKGHFAILILANDINEVYAYQKKSALIVGIGNNENYISSDVLALLPFTDKGIILNDDDLACLSDNSFKITRFKKSIEPKIIELSKMFNHSFTKTYMEKEINEIPLSVEQTVKTLFSPEGIESLPIEPLKNVESFYIAGCGSSYNACLYGKYVIEKLACVPVDVIYSSDSRFSTLFFSPKQVAIFISKSGDTLETVALLKLAKSKGSYTIAVTNIRNSSISQVADYTIYINANAEIGISATKTYNCTLVAMYVFAIKLAKLKNKISSQYSAFLFDDLTILNDDLKRVVCDDSICRYSENFLNKKAFIIGQNIDYITALEGALKFREITYSNINAYLYSELKCGNSAFVDKGSQAIFVLTNKDNLQKTILANKELSARGCDVLMVTTVNELSFNNIIYINTKSNSLLLPIISVVPLQKLALTVATEQGLSVDKKV